MFAAAPGRNTSQSVQRNLKIMGNGRLKLILSMLAVADLLFGQTSTVTVNMTTKQTQPPVGILALDGAAGFALTRSTGTPNSVVSAPPGSLCLDQNGALWLKTSGIGNTGWTQMPTISGGVPGGSTTQVQYNNAGAFGGMSGSAWDDTNRSLTLTGTTVTANHPVLNLYQLWNNAGVQFSGIFENIDITAAATNSELIRLEAAGVDKFVVQSDGTIFAVGSKFAFTTNATSPGFPYIWTDGLNLGLNAADNTRAIFLGRQTSGANIYPQGEIRLGSAILIDWANTADPFLATRDIGLARNAAGVLEVDNGTAGTFADLKLRNMFWSLQTAAPTGSEGETYYNSTNHLPYFYNGTAWTSMGGGAGVVSSVFGRTGAVVSAFGDYSISQLANLSVAGRLVGSNASAPGVTEISLGTGLGMSGSILNGVAFGASGASHAAGIAPDPGATAGTTRFLREDATWATPAGGGVPGGSTTQVQYNNAGAFGGSSAILYNNATGDVTLGTSGSAGQIKLTPINGIQGARTINFGNNYAQPAIYLYDGGSAGSRYGWALQSGEMQFFASSGHYSWNNSGDLQTSGINENMRLNPGTNLVLGNGEMFAFSSTAASSSTVDTALGRNAAGVVEVNNGTFGTFVDVKVRTVIHNGYTVATLPTGVAGMVAYVTDGAAALAWGATVTGGSTTHYLCWYNGTNWTVVGK